MPDAPPLAAPEPRPAGAPTALGHIRVIDFTHFLAGPMATLILGDLGAEIIKIEKPAGEDFRALSPMHGGEGAPFLWSNRNKRSVALDLSKSAGRAIARALIATADVVVENFSTGVMAGFGLDYASLSAGNPRLVYCSVSAYGRDGPFASRLGFDPIVQAESGFMTLVGFPDREPVRTGPSIMDVGTGMMASNAILGALMARERLGRGQYVEVSLFDTAMVVAGFHMMNYLVTGAVPNRFGNTSPDSAPMGVFHGSDGPFYLACANDRTFHRLARDVLGRPELADDPDFAETARRVPNSAKLAAILAPIFATADRETWVGQMRRAGVPAGPVRTVAEAFAAPEVTERGIASAIPHPTAGSVPNIRLPIRLAGTPLVDPVAAPTVGQHTEDVLRRVLDYDRARLDALADAGAFGPAGRVKV
ncbi:MAG: CoA transferase [Alphaproteobacteria bacterium]|nr:CoA transferase [Alphaproteobacteria bacterium]